MARSNEMLQVLGHVVGHEDNSVVLQSRSNRGTLVTLPSEHSSGSRQSVLVEEPLPVGPKFVPLEKQDKYLSLKQTLLQRRSETDEDVEHLINQVGNVTASPLFFVDMVHGGHYVNTQRVRASITKLTKSVEMFAKCLLRNSAAFKFGRGYGATSSLSQSLFALYCGDTRKFLSFFLSVPTIKGLKD
jgi:hypothetical protein